MQSFVILVAALAITPLIDASLKKEGIKEEKIEHGGITEKEPLRNTSLKIEGKCETECDNVRVTHYLEVGCEPVYAQPDCCPSHYNCDVIEGRARNKCYFKGKEYNQGDQIDSHLTERWCKLQCHCTINEFPEFQCTQIDCPEFMDPELNLDCFPGCYRTYEFDSCCSKNITCPPFDDLAKCKVSKKPYHEGELWYTKNKDKVCICQPNFNRKLEAPFCKDVECGIELHDIEYMIKKCAPVFMAQLSCPLEWKCPEGEVVIIPQKYGNKSEQQCSFGDKKLNIGDTLPPSMSNDYLVKCSCKIPPLLTCNGRPKISLDNMPSYTTRHPRHTSTHPYHEKKHQATTVSRDAAARFKTHH